MGQIQHKKPAINYISVKAVMQSEALKGTLLNQMLEKAQKWENNGLYRAQRVHKLRKN